MRGGIERNRTFSVRVEVRGSTDGTPLITKPPRATDVKRTAGCIGKAIQELIAFLRGLGSMLRRLVITKNFQRVVLGEAVSSRRWHSVRAVL